MNPKKSFKELQKYWYGKLKETGFVDLEEARPGRYLMTGYMGRIGKLYHSQEDEERPLEKEETFQEHPDFKFVCEKVSKRGSRKLSPETVARMWELHWNGFSNRKIAREIGTSECTVRSIFKVMYQWMNVL